MDEKVGQPATADHTQRKLKKRDSLDAKFKVHHYNLVDIIDNEDTEEILDGHNDEIAGLASRINTLNAACSSIDFRL